MKNLTPKLGFILILSAFWLPTLSVQADDSILDTSTTTASSTVLTVKQILENREFKLITLLENITSRLNDRILTLESQGALLIDAKTSLNSAQIKINEVKVLAETLKFTINSDYEKIEVMAQITQVKILIKEAYALLQETVKNINQQVNGN